jgi:hypothetical protein
MIDLLTKTLHGTDYILEHNSPQNTQITNKLIVTVSALNVTYSLIVFYLYFFVHKQ